ncbi:hypothetical protein ACT6CD_08790 [Campylobacter coli]|uniref:hypothetical protein n=1 Tax=Campylobacter coli TaxID=195 RepID=UPI004033F5E0
MTEIQFNEIKERLSKWRKDRHLTYRKQRNGFLGNVYEEVSEYYRSMNEYEQIDALMDIIVFTVNSFDFDYKLNEYEVISTTYFTSVLNTLTNIARTLRYYYKEVYKIENSDLDDKEKELELEKIEKEFRPSFQQHAWSIIYEVKDLTEDLGFDFYKCTLETIKEIESRCGYYNITLKKFVKNPGAYSKIEALDLAVNDFELTNTPNKYFVDKEDNDYWYIKIEDNNGDYEDYYIKKWYKADYESCRIK